MQNETGVLNPLKNYRWNLPKWSVGITHVTHMVGASKNRAGILLIHLVRVHEAVILFQSNKLVMWALFGLAHCCS